MILSQVLFFYGTIYRDIREKKHHENMEEKTVDFYLETQT